MIEAIERLLTLQDRDRRILQTRTELGNIGPEREMFAARAAGSQAALDAAKLRVKQIETERKKLELDVESKRQQIEKYSLQQFQTKKNEEYRALAHEIETNKAAIVKLEDQQLELMEHGDKVLKEVAAAAQVMQEAKSLADSKLSALAERENNLKTQLAELEATRAELASAVEEGVVGRYERQRRTKGDTVVVGITHGVCGGCHMKLPVQIVVSCQGQHELVACPNCGRILYYSHDMDLAVAD